MFDKPINVILSVCLGLALLVIVALFAMNWQLKHQLTEANNSLVAQSQNVGVLKSAVVVQNQAIEEFAEAGKQAESAVEKKLAEARPFIEQEERRIKGIRSAPVASGNDSEQIRQKMLKDAML